MKTPQLPAPWSKHGQTEAPKLTAIRTVYDEVYYIDEAAHAAHPEKYIKCYHADGRPYMDRQPGGSADQWEQILLHPENICRHARETWKESQRSPIDGTTFNYCPICAPCYNAEPEPTPAAAPAVGSEIDEEVKRMNTPARAEYVNERYAEQHRRTQELKDEIKKARKATNAATTNGEQKDDKTPAQLTLDAILQAPATPAGITDADRARRIAEYQQKRNAKHARLTARAEKARAESARRLTIARKMADFIPFGQPILIGHHSEKRDRNYRSRIDSNFRKGFNALDAAKEAEARAEAMLSNAAIFSDDPQADEKLTDKINRLEKRQEIMKATNAAIKKQDKAALIALGYTEAESLQWMTAPRPFTSSLGFQKYELTNNSANIRSLKKRLEVITRKQATPTSEETINGIKIEYNPQENRIRMYFTGRVSKEIYAELKHAAFKHTPSLGDFTWQAFYNASAKYSAQRIAEKMEAPAN